MFLTQAYLVLQRIKSKFSCLSIVADICFLIASQCIISHQALPCLLNLLTNNYKKSIKKEACWTISNITAGNKEQIHVIYKPSCLNGFNSFGFFLHPNYVYDHAYVLTMKFCRLLLRLI